MRVPVPASRSLLGRRDALFLAASIGLNGGIPVKKRSVTAEREDGSTLSFRTTDKVGIDGKLLIEVISNPPPGTEVDLPTPPSPPFRGVKRCSVAGRPGLAYIGPELEGTPSLNDDGFLGMEDRLQLLGQAIFVPDHRRAFFESGTGFDRGVSVVQWTSLRNLAPADQDEIDMVERWVAEREPSSAVAPSP
jgi:hypothetical protein